MKLLGVAVFLSSACTVPNPSYCDEAQPCSSGTCDLDTHTCSNMDASRSDGGLDGSIDAVLDACVAAGGLIVFTSDADGDSEIGRMYADGSAIEFFTDNAIVDQAPRLSPDGAKIAWTQAGPQLFVMNSDGSDIRNVSLGDATDHRWSPDSSHLLFTSSRTGNGEIFSVRADGSDLTNLTNSSGTDSQADWSPDGEQIVFRSNRSDASYEIFTMNGDGSNQEAITDRPNTVAWPSWAPDGSRIVWVDGSGASATLWTVQPNGTGAAMLAPSPADDKARWSPDSEALAWRGNSDVLRILANGTSYTNLTNDGSTSTDSQPSWSPGGERFVFQTNRDGDSEVYVMNADGSSPLNLTQSSAEEAAGNWSPCP
jgi:Tol biopolymer transport system component